MWLLNKTHYGADFQSAVLCQLDITTTITNDFCRFANYYYKEEIYFYMDSWQIKSIHIWYPREGDIQ